MAAFSEIQELHLHLIELASFNCFDGHVVADDLRSNSDLWQGVTMCRFDDFTQLVWLRDLREGEWNVDTLLIIPQPGREEKLVHLAESWQANSIEKLPVPRDWNVCLERKTYVPEFIIKVWWD